MSLFLLLLISVSGFLQVAPAFPADVRGTPSFEAASAGNTGPAFGAIDCDPSFSLLAEGARRFVVSSSSACLPLLRIRAHSLKQPLLAPPSGGRHSAFARPGVILRL